MEININLNSEAEYAIKETLMKMSGDNWLWKATIVHEKNPMKGMSGACTERTTITFQKSARE